MEDGSWMVCLLYFFFSLSPLRRIDLFFCLIPHSQTQFPVFNVTDCDGNKIRDEGILNYIQKVSDPSIEVEVLKNHATELFNSLR